MQFFLKICAAKGIKLSIGSVIIAMIAVGQASAQILHKGEQISAFSYEINIGI